MGLKAGAAEVNITPPVGVSLAGFAGRPGPSEGTADELHAGALVIDDGTTPVALVTMDLISLAPDLVERLRALAGAMGIPPERLLLNCSHTHSGPTVHDYRTMGSRDGAYEDVLCRKIAGALKMAMDRRRAARLSIGRKPVRIGCNRRELRDGRIVLGVHPEGPEAPWVDVLRVDEAAGPGTPIAVLFSTAAHPVNLNGLLLSAEFPGYAAAFLRKERPGTVPLFVQGCCGDINCGPKDGSLEASRELGRRLGAATLSAALEAEGTDGVPLAGKTLTVDLPLMVPSEDDALNEVAEARARLEAARKDPKVTGYQVAHRFGGALAWAKAYREAARTGGDPTERFEIQGLRIGPLAVLGFPGEMFVEYQLWAEAASPFERTISLGYTNGCIGYVPTAEAYPQGGYEIVQAFRHYGTMMIGPECEALIRRASSSLLSDLHQGS